MDQPKEGGTSPEFWCDICKVACASAVNLHSHFLGSRHRLLEKALKTHGIVTSDSPEPESDKGEAEVAHVPASVQVVGLGEHLEDCRATEPAIGLEYLLEYRTLGNYLWYECQLCDCVAGLTNMFLHVVGAKHRHAYIQKHYPEMGDVGRRSNTASNKLKQMAAEIEAKDGRKKIQVVTDTQQLKRKYAFEEDAAGPNKKNEIDFTSDECFLDPPPPPPQSVPPQSLPPSPTFQELKKAHAEAVKKEGLDKSVDGFGTKKDFLEYLREFQILCEDDAAFVLKVTQNFTRSMVKYREKVKEMAEAAAAAPAVTCPPQQQVIDPQPTGQNIYTEYPPKTTAGQQVNTPRLADQNKYTEYLPKTMPSEKAPPCGYNIYTEYPPKNTPGQQVNAPQPADKNKSTEYPPKNTPGQQAPPLGHNLYTEYPPKNAPGQQAPATLGHNIYTEYPPKNVPGQQVPVSGALSSAYKVGTPSFAAPPKPVVLPPANVKGLPSGLAPRQETNKATVEFFSSIKSMAAEDVSATLNKIAATNPAFKSIDISNVMKILQDSGSLKPNKGQV